MNVVVANATCLDIHMSLSVVLNTTQETNCVVSVPPAEHPGDGQGLPTSLLFLPTSREDLRLERYLE
ncbi:hypothetical protein TNCV_2843141 [Trichonephila clavipes]|nr:hypothetical protein TNCV_2843141 [Trichonephila clavipes]